MVAVMVLLWAQTPAFGEWDRRVEARQAMEQARKLYRDRSDAAHLIRGIEISFETAEQLFGRGDGASAQRYYLLTLQQASLMCEMLGEKPRAVEVKIARGDTGWERVLPPPAAPVPAAKPPVAAGASAAPAAPAPTPAPVPPGSAAPAPASPTRRESARAVTVGFASGRAETPPAAPVGSERAPGSPPPVREGKAPAAEPEQEPSDADAKARGKGEATPDEAVGEELPSLVGGIGSYTVGKGETLKGIGAKLGVEWRQIARMNRLKTDGTARLQAGQRLKINTRRIVPKRMDDGVVINIPDRTIYLFRQGKVARTVPVSVGKPGTRKKPWQTPVGSFNIVSKEKYPTWRVPVSIQKELKEQGKEVSAQVPPGKKNPLGKYLIRTSIPSILIHSTNAPGSIYQFSSHGCIRVHPELMEGLFREVRVSSKGEIVYEPVKLARDDQGRIYLEVHRDVYGKLPDLEHEARRMIEEHRWTGRVDWKKVSSVVRGCAGTPEEITLR